jgi:hypothetical protein
MTARNLNEAPAMGLPEAARRLQENGVVVCEVVVYEDNFAICTASGLHDGFRRHEIIEMALALRGRETGEAQDA